MSQGQLKDVGEILKSKRNELNISLKDAENATSIRLSHLHAIEEGEMSKLISPVYAQGFVKQYATFLGLDGDQIIREHPGIFTTTYQNQSQEFSYGIGTLEMRGHPAGSVKWIPNFGWTIAFAAVLGVAWYLAKAFEVI